MKKHTFLIVFIFTIILQSCYNGNTKIEKSEKINNTNSENVITKSINNELKIPIEKELFFDIEGDYFFKDELVDCKIKLKLFYTQEQLRYTLKTNSREISDIATIKLNEQKNGYYITLQNIKWCENIGAIDSNGEALEKNLTLPQEVQGTLINDEILIQNYGNSMNYYLIFSECDVKYIYLIRKEKSKNK